MSLSADEQKRTAAARAAGLVGAGMRIGLGTGSTAAHLIRILGQRVGEGLDVTCVPTSEATAALAREAGLSLGHLDDLAPLDLTIDGADELDADLNLIKGGGGALLREKIVAGSSRRMIVIADQSKLVPVLGAYPLPVEIVRFGAASTEARIAAALEEHGLQARVGLRHHLNQPFVTDEGHFIVDCAIDRIEDPKALGCRLSSTVGVVEHGLFVGIATEAILGRADGTVTMLGES